MVCLPTLIKHLTFTLFRSPALPNLRVQMSRMNIARRGRAWGRVPMCMLFSKTCHKSQLTTHSQIRFCTQRHTYVMVINTQCVLHQQHELERFLTHSVLHGLAEKETSFLNQLTHSVSLHSGSKLTSTLSS